MEVANVSKKYRIIDYVIEQCEIDDKINLKMEHEVIHNVGRLYDTMSSNVIKIAEIYGDTSTQLKLEILLGKIKMYTDIFYSDMYKILVSSVGNYYQRGSDNYQQLIQVGLDIQGKLEKNKVVEIKGQVALDVNSIEHMKNHAFEQVTKINADIQRELRQRLGELIVQNRVNRSSVMEIVKDVMDTNDSRADMIAQTEMSYAYNYGALSRFDEYNRINDGEMKKYWHGFKYSQITCPYCRQRIGNTYEEWDMSEELPAHPRCRCVWLPYLEGWDKPISTIFTRNANMLKRAYSSDEIYTRINKRLNIDYAKYIGEEDANSYLRGDRSETMVRKIRDAREMAIEDEKSNFDIARESADDRMGKEFNDQLIFWKKYVSQGIVDKDTESLGRAYEAIKGVMILPWSGTQLDKWSKILDDIKEHM
jgi:hypothetical protein